MHNGKIMKYLLESVIGIETMNSHLLTKQTRVKVSFPMETRHMGGEREVGT